MKTGKGYVYGDACKKLVQHWSDPDLGSPHLLIRQPKNGGVGCKAYVESLAAAYYQRQPRSRTFKQSYLSLKYPDGRPGDFQRFFDSPSMVASYYNRFEGVFCIDLSHWVGRAKSREFDMLLEYLASHQENVQYIFTAAAPSPSATRDLYNRLSRVLRIRELEMNYPDAGILTAFALEALEGKGISLEKEAEGVLETYIEELSVKEAFVGYETVERLVDEVAFALQEETCQKGPVSENKLADLSELCLNCVPEAAQAARMGF